MQNETTESASAPRVRTAHYIFSDFHLGQGRQEDGEWHRMEDFRSDREFALMLRHIHERHAPDEVVKLHANGDIFDFMAVPYRGSYLAVPTVEAALEEFRAIAAGHPEFFAALRWFMSVRPNAVIEETIGNHDQDLAWTELQDALRAQIVPPDQFQRVRFVREGRVGPVVIRHGDQFDRLNAVPSDEEMFITDKKGGGTLPIAFLIVLLTHGAILSLIKRPGLLFSPGTVALGLVEFLALMVIVGWAWSKLYFWKWGKSQRFMNYPFAYYMNAGLGMTLKRLFMPDMGRMQDHGAIWVTTIARSPYWAPVMWLYLTSDILFHMFFIDRLSVRRKASLKTIWRLLASTMHEDRIDEELDRYAKEHPDVKYVVAGHTHVFGVKNVNVGDRVMMYLNAGTWVEMRDMVQPQIKTVTRFPRVEAFFRRILLTWRRAPATSLAVAFVHACFASLPFLSDVAFGWSFGFWAYLFPALSLFLLIWRYSYTEYKGTPFTKLTLAQLDEYENGEIAIVLNRYLPPAPGEEGNGRFENAL